jgi:hypothetical protein
MFGGKNIPLEEKNTRRALEVKIVIFGGKNLGGNEKHTITFGGKLLGGVAPPPRSDPVACS